MHAVSENFTTQFKILDETSALIHRTMHVGAKTIRHNVMPGVWALALGFHDGDTFRAWHGGKLIGGRGWIGSFLPPFCIVEWHIDPGQFAFTSFFSHAVLPANAPRTPIYFPLEPERFPTTTQATLRLVSSVKGSPLGLGTETTAVAAKLKKLIDQHFSDTWTVADFARSLGYSHAVMTRQFKKSFRLSPVQYRNELRVGYALRSVLFSPQNIADTAMKTGFEDVSQFHRQFRKKHETTPASIRSPKV